MILKQGHMETTLISIHRQTDCPHPYDGTLLSIKKQPATDECHNPGEPAARYWIEKEARHKTLQKEPGTAAHACNPSY
jgi:hypothetical protein